jgi:tripartite-type tricarboxylate transporter receptor subunit TctC
MTGFPSRSVARIRIEVGTISMLLKLLKTLAGIDIIHVPYRGALIADVIGGRVPMTFQNMGAILPTVREGKLRGLAVTSLKRSPSVSELPSVAESGFPGFEGRDLAHAAQCATP